MDSDLKQRVKRLLEPDEHLWWVGRPSGPAFARDALPLYVFAVPWTAFSLFWEGGVILQGDGAGMIVFGLPFVAIGLAMLSAPFWVLARAGRTAYAVTDRRAMLVDLRDGTVQGYGPEELTDLRLVSAKKGPADVVFTTDRRRDMFFPSAPLKVNKAAYTSIGFGKVEDAEAARRHLEALALTTFAPGAAPRPPRAASGQLLEAQGSFDAFLVKLRALVRTRRQAAAERHRKAWTIYQTVFGVLACLDLLWMFNLLQHGPASKLSGVVLASAFVGLPAAGLVAWLMRVSQKTDLAAIDRDDGFRQVLSGWQPDVHARSPLLGFRDMGQAHDTKPERSAKSPHSGATKTYHRHHWGQLFWAFADGNMLALNVVDKVKYKSGAEVKREHQVRGRLAVNPHRYDTGGWPERLSVAGLTIRPVRHGGRTHLLMSGTVARIEDLPEVLTAIYRRLTPSAQMPAA